MAQLYPPEASDRFVSYAKHTNKDKSVTKVDVETLGDGFRMTFKTGAIRTFKATIDMPKTAKHGGYMFDYYVSVFSTVPLSGSMIETGISFSEMYGWKLAITAPAWDPNNNNQGVPYNGDPLGKSLDLFVTMKEPERGAKAGRFEINLGGQTAIVDWLHPKEVGHIRLVSASGDIRGSHWDDMGMSLKEIDGRAPASIIGHPEWMHGRKLTEATRRVIWEGGNAHGFRCRLPPEAKPAGS